MMGFDAGKIDLKSLINDNHYGFKPDNIPGMERILNKAKLMYGRELA